MAERGELLTVADDEVVCWHGPRATRLSDLPPDTVVDTDGINTRTLPRFGELLCRIATVNDVHFGETEAGRIGDSDEWPTFSVPEGAEPYPSVMNRSAVHDIARWDPDLVVVKGDLTSTGTMAEYEAFRSVYEPAFGSRLMVVRGNHESFHRLAVADDPFQQRELPGVIVVLLDTSREGLPNGDLTPEQLERLDELAARADRPVLVFGHHPLWDASSEPRRDSTFGLLPDASESLVATFARRPALAGYFAGHTHRNRVVRHEACPEVPFAEVACVKDFPGAWAEYRVFDGGILQVHRRITGTRALEWTERTRGMFGGAYPAYALGRSRDRCFVVRAPSEPT